MLADVAVYENGRIHTASPPFTGALLPIVTSVYQVNRNACAAFAMADTLWYDAAGHLAQSLIFGGFSLGSMMAGLSIAETNNWFGPFSRSISKIPIALPCEKTFDVVLTNLKGEELTRVTVIGPPRGEFAPKDVKITNDHVPPVVKSFSIPDASEGVFYDRWLEVYFDEKAALESVTKETIRVTDSKGKEIPGKLGLSPVPGRVLAPSRTQLTFIPRHGWPANETITVEVTGIKDDADNVMDRVYRTTFKTYAPRILAQVKDESGKPLESVYDLDYLPNTVVATAKLDNGLDGIATVDVSDPEQPKLLTRVNVLGHPMAVKTFRGATITDRNGQNPRTGDFALVAGRYVGYECYAYLSLVDLNDPKAPAPLGEMIVAKNVSQCYYPEEGRQGRLYESPGYPNDVAAIGGQYAYVAVLGMGLQAYETNMLPYVTPGYQQLPSGMLPEYSYRGLGSVGDKLLAVRNHTVEVLSAGLTSLSTDETLTLPYYVRGVKDFPIDLNRDGSITQEEVIDLAITSQRGGVVIHQVTAEGVLNRLDFIHLNGMSKESGVGDLCVDRRRRLLYIGGVKLSTGENGLYVISLYDLPRPGEAALGVYGTKILDENLDGQDDRVIGFIPNAGGCNAVNDDVTVAYNIQGGVQIIDLGLGANSMFVECASPCVFHSVQQNLVYADARVRESRRVPLKTLSKVEGSKAEDYAKYQVRYRLNKDKITLGGYAENTPRDLDANWMTTNQYQAGDMKSGREYLEAQLHEKASDKPVNGGMAAVIIYNYHEYDFNQILTDEEYATTPSNLDTAAKVEAWLAARKSVLANRGGGEVSAGATAVLVDGGDEANAALPASGIIRIDKEEIEYNGQTLVDGYKPALMATRRGANGTTPAMHNAGNANALVYLGTQIVTVGTSPTGAMILEVAAVDGGRVQGELILGTQRVYYTSKTASGFVLSEPMAVPPAPGTPVFYPIGRAGTLVSRIIVEESRKVASQPVSVAVILTHLKKEYGLVDLKEGTLKPEKLNELLNDAMGVTGVSGLLNELVHGIGTARKRFYEIPDTYQGEITKVTKSCKPCNYYYAEPEGSVNIDFTLTPAERLAQKAGGKTKEEAIKIFKSVKSRHGVKLRIMNRATRALYKYTTHVTVWNVIANGARGGNSLFAKCWKDLGFGH